MAVAINIMDGHMHGFGNNIVWHKNFTWNLILQFYSTVSGRTIKLKIHKLDVNLQSITMTLSMKLGFYKI